MKNQMVRNINKSKAGLESFRLKRKVQEQKEQIHQLKQYIDVLKNLVKEKLINEEFSIKH